MASALPPSLADALRPTLPALVEDMIAAIGREIPDYRRPMEGDFGRAVRVGVQRALSRFVERIGDSESPDLPVLGIYGALGRGEMRVGRSLAALLSAYRIGARMAWERFVAAGAAAGHEPETLYALASAIFLYIDAISAQSVDGYADEQARMIGERERTRRALVRLLARDDVTIEEITDLAVIAGWPLAQSVAAIVADPDAERGLARLGADVVVVVEEGQAIAFLADPDAPGRRAQLATALAGTAASLGPSVPPARAAHSLARARAALGLLRAGRVARDQSPLIADDHLLELLLHGGDATIGAELAAGALAPLDALGPAAREKLVATLHAWIDNPGQVQRVAGVLEVHPQTVRYRIGQLRDCFGDALDEPDARFRLAVALRARRDPDETDARP